jgi:DNA-binding CsgD family transcriptional regulator
MVRCAASPEAPPITPDPQPVESVEDLIRMLVQKVEGVTPLREAEPISPILCVNIDGLQYTLLRSQAKDSCHLSPRESEIVRLVAEGMPNKCISAVLQISSWTVATHLRRIFAKLGVGSRAAMVARLLDMGIVRKSRSR